MRTINSFILLCVFCLFCQPTLAQHKKTYSAADLTHQPYIWSFTKNFSLSSSIIYLFNISRHLFNIGSLLRMITYNLCLVLVNI
ncbi:hypothetical protein BFS16_01880 [Hoylesella timonensis]|uniref:Uncharacterized protein n=1 Tax=Hoylesella timonensis TaxID=386414 RepID=A0A2K0XMW2_9BACT|nr:hypothetical protein BFS16_01880 [Hoylesella timonensis]